MVMQDQLRQNIVNIIKQKGISINGLEKTAGLRKNFVSSFLHDKSRNPRVDSIAKISVALGVSIDELIGEGSEHKNHDLTIARMDILLDTLNHLSTSLRDKKNNKLKLENICKATYEIYSFSLKKDSFDKEFADWFISSQL
jgi:transcriptional regulator with XRE-family HTH domain